MPSTSRVRIPALAGVGGLLLACGGLIELGPHRNQLGPDGGALRLEELGVTLSVPPGALAAPVVLSLESPSDPGEGRARAVEVRPETVQFAAPATLAYDLQADAPEQWKVYQLLSDGGVTALGSRRQLDAGVYLAPIGRAGTFALIASSEVCDDQLDNDGDGRTDCVDPACENAAVCQTCDGDPCGSGSHCCPTALSCTPNGCDDCCTAPVDGGQDGGAGGGEDAGTDGGA